MAADEFKLLQVLQSVGLPTPTPYHLDQSGEIFPAPYVVIEYVEGEPGFASSSLAQSIPQFATILAKIHGVDCSDLGLSFLPEQEKVCAEELRKRPAKVDESWDEGRIRETLKSVWPLRQRNRRVLLHGDFWPRNTLWKDGRLMAVIDWENAALGDPLADVAKARLEILWAFGIDAMNGFTSHYQSLMPTVDFSKLPYRDLYADLGLAPRIAEWGVDELTERALQDGHRLFVSGAFAQL